MLSLSVAFIFHLTVPHFVPGTFTAEITDTGPRFPVDTWVLLYYSPTCKAHGPCTCAAMAPRRPLRTNLSSDWLRSVRTGACLIAPL
jgi:hypothetical protein